MEKGNGYIKISIKINNKYIPVSFKVNENNNGLVK
jgi:hypothetical protein